jgi:hypothetical protein
MDTGHIYEFIQQWAKAASGAPLLVHLTSGENFSAKTARLDGSTLYVVCSDGTDAIVATSQIAAIKIGSKARTSTAGHVSI